MADSEVDTTQQVDTTQHDTTQQVTLKTPPAKTKNPKRVAAGKAIAAKTKQAREAQKKALAEAQIIIANSQIKTDPPVLENAKAMPDPPVLDPPAENAKITTTQWLSVISIIVSLVGLYYKREEIKSVFTKPAVLQQPSPVLPRAPPPSPATPKSRTRMMD